MYFDIQGASCERVHCLNCIRSQWLYPGGGGYSSEFLVGVCRPVLNSYPYFRPKHAIFTPVFRPDVVVTNFPTGFAVIKLRISAKVKNWSNLARTLYFGYFSFSIIHFGVKKFIRSRWSLENHTRFQTKMVKIYTRFQTKTKNHTLWGGTYLHSLYRGVPPPPVWRACISKGKLDWIFSLFGVIVRSDHSLCSHC